MATSALDANTAPTTRASRRCLACGAAGVANRCGGCRRVHFCDRECQRRAWVAHRPECLKMREASEDPKVEEPKAEEPAPVASEADVRIPDASAKATEACVRERLGEKEHFLSSSSPASSSPASSAPPSAAKRKSKSKHKRKKPRSKSLHLPSTAAPSAADGSRHGGDASRDASGAGGGAGKPRSASLGGKKHIMWGDVRAREFARFPGGGGAVPYDGTWALGLGSRVADVQLGSVLEVEALKAEALKARARELPKPQRALVREGETRQFDYRRGVDNPLFSRLTERERKQLFTSEAAPAAAAPHQDRGNGGGGHRHGSARRRKGSVSLSPALLAATEAPDVDAAPLDSPDLACVSIEQLDEFAKIRDSRDGACGCSCGDLSKKVAKMTARRLAGFLHDRGVEDTHGMGRPQLLALAKQLAAEEKSCQAPDSGCECARNGVPCHSDVCEGCAGQCANPLNRYEYNKDEVRAYRRERIAAWQAQQQEQRVDASAPAPSAVRVA